MKLLERLWPYVKKYLNVTALAVVCTLIVSGTSGATAWLIKPVLDDIFVKADTTKLAPLSFAVLTILFWVRKFGVRTAKRMQIRMRTGSIPANSIIDLVNSFRLAAARAEVSVVASVAIG